jgi:hypothetical protein
MAIKNCGFLLVIKNSTFLVAITLYFLFLIDHCSVKIGEEKFLSSLTTFLWPTYLINSGFS